MSDSKSAVTPVLNEPRRFGLRVVWIFAITFFIMLGGASLALWTNWTDKRQDTKTRLLHDASMVSAMLDVSLIDALKLLEITRYELQKIDYLHADDTQIHDVLNASDKSFGFYKRDDVFGRLFYVDKNGRIVAQNALGQLPEVNVADRHYFKTLQSNPGLRFAIGNLVKGRITGNSVFHIAVAVTDLQHEFAGLILQQIKADEFSVLIRMSHAQVGETLATFLPDGQVVFAFSEIPATQSIEAILPELVQNPVAAQGVAEYGEAQNAQLIGYITSPIFGLSTMAAIPKDVVIKEFMHEQQYLLLYIIGAAVSIAVMLLLLYKKYVSLAILKACSIHDPLTGIFNRRGLDEQVPELMRQAARAHQPISVLFVDIDHFKLFNDELGHQAGDQLLVRLSQLMAAALKRPLDFLCRWGGEEFVLILPETDQASAVHVAQRILKQVRQMPIADKHSDRHITVSIGISTLVNIKDNCHEELIDQADQAMFKAKNSGRDRFVVYKTS